MPNLKLFDIEASNLNANWGIILCCGFKTVGLKDLEVVSIADFKSFKKDPTDDKALCVEISKRLSQADAWITHYGRRFDVPFINTRLLYHKLPPLPPVPHIDTWRIAKNNLKLHSNRLAAISDFLNLTSKTPITGPAWVRALAGHKPSLQYIINHCEADIIVLEEAYMRLRHLCPQHPILRLFDGERPNCPVCGSNNVQRRGEYVALTRVYQRFQCQHCGGWYRDEKPLRGTKARNVA